MKFLLDYIMDVTVVEPTAEASTAFLKQVCVVANPKSGQEGNVGNIYECTTMTEVAARTDNTEAQELFDAGMSRVYILLADDLDIADALSSGDASDFFTVLISSDFVDADIGSVTSAAVKASKKIQDITYTAKTAGTAGNSITINYNTGGTGGTIAVDVTGSAITLQIEDGVSTAAQIKTAVENSVPAMVLLDALAVDSGDESDPQAVFGAAVNLENGAAASVSGELDFGTFDGVVGVSSTDDDFLEDQAVIRNRVAFHTTASNDAKNMFYAFGKLLSNLLNWKNQQYIELPYEDDVDNRGDAVALFDDRISFCLTDDEFGNVLAFFGAGGKAIIAPYIERNLQVDMQSTFLQYVSGNQPQYTLTEAALIEKELQAVVDSYIERGWLTDGIVEVSLVQDNFVIGGEINIAPPTGLWRMVSEMKETL